MHRFEVLRPHLERGAQLVDVAAAGSVSLRTLQRWLAAYRCGGLAALAPKARSDRGTRRVAAELVALVEALALGRPKPSASWIHRQVAAEARSRDLRPPSYRLVCDIVSGLDPALVTLAHGGARAYSEAFDLLCRHEAQHPNAVWQADHTRVDILLADGERPWLTIVIDDYSRAVAGYSLTVAAPSALGTSLALRQAMWPKPDPGWDLCGIPDVLYVDHGSDFISAHLKQVAADLKMQLVHSAVGQPRGRGKIERFFRTLNQLFASTQPGYITEARPATAPTLTLSELDERLRRFLVNDYNDRPHREIGQTPRQRWNQHSFMPRLPDSLEDLDLLLATVAKPRIVHRDGIRFSGHRYFDTTLAGYIGDTVTIRYDPADLAEIRVFWDNTFICRAICAELAGHTVSLKDITNARRRRRQQIRAELDTRRSITGDYLTTHRPPPAPTPATKPQARPSSLKRYHND